MDTGDDDQAKTERRRMFAKSNTCFEKGLRLRKSERFAFR
jgi:hypothetical protein